MAGLLDYYKEHPELWAENEYLLKKDPAYDLGMMDLDVMSFQDRPGGKYPSPQTTGIGKYADKLGSFFGLHSQYEPKSRTLGAYMLQDQPSGRDSSIRFPELTTGNIGIFMEPFAKGDAPMPWTDPNLVPPSERMNEPLYNIDKAQVMAHEGRHKATHENPELYEAQPTWTALNVQPDDPDAEKKWWQTLFGLGSTAEYKASRKEKWRNEVFNRFMDQRYYPGISFRGMSAEAYPRGRSAVDLRPKDMYFDKIWRDHWEPYAKNYEKIQKRIAARRNVPGTPIVPMGGGRGRNRPDRGGADLSPGGGYGQSPTGSDIAGTPFSRGGILGAF